MMVARGRPTTGFAMSYSRPPRPDAGALRRGACGWRDRERRNELTHALWGVDPSGPFRLRMRHDGLPTERITAESLFTFAKEIGRIADQVVGRTMRALELAAGTSAAE